MIMLNFTDDVDLLLNGEATRWSETTDEQLRAHSIDRIDTEVVSAFPADEDTAESWLGGLTFTDGTNREYLGGFAMYDKEYNTSLAESLGCDLADDEAIKIDEYLKTNVEGVYAVGDIILGQNHTSIAISDGARAGIALHKSLRRYLLSLDELESDTSADERYMPNKSDDLRARMRHVRNRDVHASLRKPMPKRPEENPERTR